MNKRICIYGIFLIIVGFTILTFSIIGNELITCGLVVIGLGVLLDEHKGS